MRRPSDLSAFEFIVVLATKPVGLNSAHGGHGVLDYRLSADFEAVAARLSDKLVGPAPNMDDVELELRESDFQEDVRKHFIFMHDIFKGLDKESVGKAMSDDMLSIVSKYNSISYPLVYASERAVRLKPALARCLPWEDMDIDSRLASPEIAAEEGTKRLKAIFRSDHIT